MLRTGDQVGAANIRDRHLDVQFRSVTGGVGRLPELPILTVTAPVLSTAAAGVVSIIAIKSGECAIRHPAGDRFHTGRAG